MSSRQIIKIGDEALTKKCHRVEYFDAKLHRLLEDMKQTLVEANGCGLAAPQVGILRRVCLVDVQDEDGVIELINPEIIETQGEQREAEGCLSVPGKWGVTVRPMKVTVRAMDRDGKPFTVTGEGLKARALCHEIDHLDGVLFTSKVIEYLED